MPCGTRPLGPATLIYSGRRGYPDAPLVVSELLSTLGQDGRQRWRATAELGMDARGKDPEAKMRVDAWSQGHETKTAAAITASGSRNTRHDGTQKIMVSSGRNRRGVLSLLRGSTGTGGLGSWAHDGL